MITYSKHLMGTLTIRQNGKLYRIQIRRGNCLAVLIHVSKNPESTSTKGRYYHTLFMFYHDEQHIKNLLKDGHGLLDEEVVSMQLNMYYKGCWTLLKYFTQEGHKVTAYYKEPKENED